MSTELAACGLTPCPEHGTLCAYHGTEADRCQWCHSSWSVIVARGSHSCERMGSVSGSHRADRRERMARAAKAREHASSRLASLTRTRHCTHGRTDPAGQRTELAEVRDLGSARRAIVLALSGAAA